MLRDTNKTILQNSLNTNINTNNAQAITGAIMNAFLNDFLIKIESSLIRATTAPTTDLEARFWFNLTTEKLNVRNAANDAWIELGVADIAIAEIDLGNGCILTVAGDIIPANWDYTKAAGQGTITIPANSYILNGTIIGAGGDGIYTDGNYVQAFRVNFKTTGGTFNTSYATALAKSIEIVDGTNQGNIDVTTPLIFDQGLIQKSICAIGTNEIGIGLNRISQFYTTGWMLLF